MPSGQCPVANCRADVLIVFVNCICTISSSSICISGHGLVVGGALCLEIRMGPVAHCICNWYLYLYF